MVLCGACAKDWKDWLKHHLKAFGSRKGIDFYAEAATSVRAPSSEEERCLDKAEVAGSNPAAHTDGTGT